jgi:Short C-terminal domain/Phospholipase_D-nuclease N-terminal
MPLLDVFWTMLWFFLWVVWFWLLITVFADIFRSDDLSGWGKAAWVLFTVFLPYLGVFVYLIARGKSMQERGQRQAVEAERATRSYIREVSADAKPSTAEELTKLAGLRDAGVLSDDEFQAQKAKLLVAQ